MKPAIRSRTRFLFLVPLLAVPLMGSSLPTGKPEDVGVSSERLQRISETLQRHIDAGDIAGAVSVVARRGRVVHFEAHGFMDVEAKKPMTKDAIFPLASMSKPLTAVAVLMLVEEGKVRLTDPLSKFVPELKDMKVAVAVTREGNRPPAPQGPGAPDPEYYLVPTNRDVTVFDLLTHTAGLVTGGIGARMAPKLAPRGPSDTLASYIPKLAAVPLDFQPGTQWRYSGFIGFEVLSRIVEVASGQPFDQFMKQRIFDPLDMKDTFYVLPEDRKARFVSIYQHNASGLVKRTDLSQFVSHTYLSGASGVMTTAEDLLQFGQMLANEGQLDGKRLLSPKTVEMMDSNHVGEMFGFPDYPSHGVGYGLGVAVVMDETLAEMRVSNGSFGWTGAFGTRLWVDPKEKMVDLLMLQTNNAVVRSDFENAVMQALVE